MNQQCAPCIRDPRELPSSVSAIELVDGKPGAGITVLLHMTARAVLIGSGLYLFGGDRNPRLWQRAMASSAAIEVFAITWASARKAPLAP